MDEAAAQHKARAIEEMIAASPVVAGGTTVQLGASVGATLLTPGDSAEDALARADRAMYARKHERKRR